MPLRHYLDLGDVGTERHLDLGAKVMLAAGMVVAYSYLNEIFFAWYSGEEAHRYMM